MLYKSKDVFLAIITAVLIFSSTTVFADKFSKAVVNEEPCPVNPAYPNNNSLFDGSSLTGIAADQVIDAEFGLGAQKITQCLKKREDVKLVVRVNDTFRTDAFGQARLNKAMYFSNIDKFINQYTNTHDLKFGKDVDVVVVLGGSGAALATTQHPIFKGAAVRWNKEVDAGKHPGQAKLDVSMDNPYVDVIKNAMKMGIKFYLCQEASRTLKISMKNKIEGIYFVPAAHAATADFIQDGYAIIIP